MIWETGPWCQVFANYEGQGIPRILQRIVMQVLGVVHEGLLKYTKEYFPPFLVQCLSEM